MFEPVAVLSPIDALRIGLTSMLSDSSFCPETPDDPDGWLDDDHRLLLVAVADMNDLRQVIGQRRVTTPVAVVLLPELSADIVRRAILAGACSVACWNATREEVVSLLAAAREARSIVPTAALQSLARNSRSLSTTVRLDQEHVEWLRALAQGETVEHLAMRVAYSEREVYRILRGIYERLGVHSRTEALIWAAQQGIVQ